MDDAARVRLRLDIVWYRRDHPVAVADAKYKAGHGQAARYPNDDLYQMLAYCIALGLPRGHLIYARGAAKPARHVVREAAIEMVTHALDLDAEPAAMLSQIGDLAALLAGRHQQALITDPRERGLVDQLDARI